MEDGVAVRRQGGARNRFGEQGQFGLPSDMQLGNSSRRLDYRS